MGEWVVEIVASEYSVCFLSLFCPLTLSLCWLSCFEFKFHAEILIIKAISVSVGGCVYVYVCVCASLKVYAFLTFK